jgi:hypothetical protein
LAYILLNQPGKLNALDEQMLEAIERCFCVWESEGQVKVTNGLKLAPQVGLEPTTLKQNRQFLLTRACQRSLDSSCFLAYREGWWRF